MKGISSCAGQSGFLRRALPVFDNGIAAVRKKLMQRKPMTSCVPLARRTGNLANWEDAQGEFPGISMLRAALSSAGLQPTQNAHLVLGQFLPCIGGCRLLSFRRVGAGERLANPVRSERKQP